MEQTNFDKAKNISLDITNTNINFSCGCGFISQDGYSAQRHVIETRHAITVQGMIRPSK